MVHCAQIDVDYTKLRSLGLVVDVVESNDEGHFDPDSLVAKLVSKCKERCPA